MNSFSNINIQLLEKQAYRLYNHQYFQYIVAITCISLAFLFGRLLHQKKFSNLLNMINDAETTRKKINSEKYQIQQSIRSMQSKKYLFLSLLFIVVAAIGVWVYYMKKIDINLLMKIAIGITVIIVIIWVRVKYLKWMKRSLQTKLKQSQLTTENQVKQILAQIGPEIEKSLKFKLQREIQDNIKKEQLKQCQLSRCSNQKRTYQKLYLLYKTVISEMTKFTWCQICSSQSNINIMDLGMQEFQANLVLYKKLGADAKFLSKIQKSKQLINKMLEEWSNLQPKLQQVCKRGCCIKFRELIDGLKNQHFKGLNELKASLRAI